MVAALKKGKKIESFLIKKVRRPFLPPNETETNQPSRSWTTRCCYFDCEWFAFLLNPYHKRFCDLVARISTVVRNARQYMPDLACFNYLLTHSFNLVRQLAFNEIGELVTVRVDMTRQCLAGRPIGSGKQYFLSGNALQISTKNGASARSGKLRIDCSRSCNPHTDACCK